MTYSLFCTDASIRSAKVPDLGRVVAVKLDSMGAAISEAIRLIGDGVIVWRIEGSDGFLMERGDIEAERSRRQEIASKTIQLDEPTTSALAKPRERQRLFL